VTAFKEAPPLTFATETSPSEATISAIESGLTAHAAGLGLRTDWSPRWIVGRDEGEVVQAGIRFVLAFGSYRPIAGLSRGLSRHIHVSGAEILRAAWLSGNRPAQ
jgi:hypothetical protein